jgi:hypothetical protein
MRVKAKPTESDLVQYSIDLPISQNLSDFSTAQKMVTSGAKDLARRFPHESRRWTRWRTWWMSQLAERNERWANAERYLTEMLADRGVRGTDRTAAYAALGRVLGRLRRRTARRVQILQAALRLGARHPDPTLFSVMTQLEEVDLLTWSGPARGAIRHLVTKCLEPPMPVPKNLDDMRRLVRSWRVERAQ